jgi:hypothetical protein
MLRRRSDDAARRAEQDNAVKRLQRKWRTAGAGLVTTAKQRRAQERARAATAAPVGRGRIGYAVQYLAIEAAARRQAEIERQVRAVQEAQWLATEEARRQNELLPILRAQIEVEMHQRNMAALAPVLRMEEELRQLQRLSCPTPGW